MHYLVYSPRNPAIPKIHLKRIGKKAAEKQKLVKVIECKDEPIENIVLKTTMKIRSSCGCNGCEGKLQGVLTIVRDKKM